MAYEKAGRLKAEDFKRLCGVHRETFDQMVETVKKGLPIKKKTGRPSKLSLEDQVLMTLEYWREYRTYFHIGQSWGVDEATAYRIIRKIEDILIKAAEFHLPGKKQLLQESDGEEAVIVDVTETPVEKPKKNRSVTIVARRKSIR
jgi:Helix-turn-helix of DDE superfamily endonuclease